MRVLVVGNGGREAALAWKLAASSEVSEVHITPFHPAAATLHAKIHTSESELSQILQKKFTLAVIGPEAFLAEGLADKLRSMGIPTVGPSALAAELETSKTFAKKIMQLAGVPTARAASFQNTLEAQAFINLCDWPGVVIKADGPAQGKGVVVCESKTHAQNIVHEMMSGAYLGTPVSTVLLEEKLHGVEISAFALCTGEDFVWLGSARDHKRLLEGDRGPNTGGMGTVSPVEMYPGEELFIKEQIFAPILKTMKQEGRSFQGFLFAGLMRTAEGLKVLEFNVRLGDPETQVLLPRLSDDLFPWLMGCANSKLPSSGPTFTTDTCVHIVMAAPGYPGTEGHKLVLGDVVPWRNSESLAFPAGLTFKNSHWVTRGGRVLGVSALAPDLSSAREIALRQIETLSFSGAQWRRDIGGLL